MECRDCDHYKAKHCRHQCMYLPEGKTCSDCVHIERCTFLMGTRVKPQNTSCDFEPIRFREKVEANAL